MQKNQALSLIPSTYTVPTYALNPSTREAETGRSLGLLASLPAYSANPKSQLETLSPNDSVKVWYTALISVLRSQKQVDLCEFQKSLELYKFQASYIVRLCFKQI